MTLQDFILSKTKHAAGEYIAESFGGEYDRQMKSHPRKGRSNLMALLSKILLTVLSLAVASPAFAGQRKQLVPSMGCVRTISPGQPLLTGIPTGILSKHIYIQRCGDMWMSHRSRNGKPQSYPIQGNFLARYKARNKPHATPDARVAISNKVPHEAWLTQPTRRYTHGIMGDNIEGGALKVIRADGKQTELVLDKKFVFEDRIARLVDLTGDGQNEILVVRSSLETGASLAIYGMKNKQIVPLAQTKHIGKTNRWLNPAVAADLDGDGKIEIAYVETPHIGGILKIIRLERDGGKYWIRSIAALPGFSNHKLGSSELLQAVTLDWDGDGSLDIILPGAARETLKVVSLKKGALLVIDEMKIGGEIDSPLIAADLDGNGTGEVLLVTKDARILSFSPR